MRFIGRGEKATETLECEIWLCSLLGLLCLRVWPCELNRGILRCVCSAGEPALDMEGVEPGEFRIKTHSGS